MLQPVRIMENLVVKDDPIGVAALKSLALMASPKSRDLTSTLISAIKQMIADGTLQPGNTVPPERELARQFSVDRASLRQALQALGVMGVIRQRAGAGTHLNEDAWAILNVPPEFLLLVDGITFAELFEARRIFEPELAARAASRHRHDEIVQLERSFTRMKRHAKSGFLAEVAECDQNFHHLIWKMAGNRLCLRICWCPCIAS